MEKSPFRKGILNYLIRSFSYLLTEKNRKQRAAIFIGLLITLLVTGVMLLKLSPLETLEEKLYDYRFKIRGTTKPPDTVVNTLPYVRAFLEITYKVCIYLQPETAGQSQTDAK